MNVFNLDVPFEIIDFFKMAPRATENELVDFGNVEKDTIINLFREENAK